MAIRKVSEFVYLWGTADINVVSNNPHELLMLNEVVSQGTLQSMTNKCRVNK